MGVRWRPRHRRDERDMGADDVYGDIIACVVVLVKSPQVDVAHPSAFAEKAKRAEELYGKIYVFDCSHIEPAPRLPLPTVRSPESPA